jgi:hypothetical protein
LRSIEKYCWQDNRNKAAESFYIPAKNKKILIAGGGLVGICCAVKLAGRGYNVTIAEKRDRLGGRLWELRDELPEVVLQEELSRVFRLKFLEVFLNKEVTIQDKGDYDAIFLTFATPMLNGEYFREGIFYDRSGIRTKQTPLLAIKMGVEMSYALEDYVKRGVIREPEEKNVKCKFQPSRDQITPMARTAPRDPLAWSVEDAKSETDRCILCIPHSQVNEFESR